MVLRDSLSASNEHQKLRNHCYQSNIVMWGVGFYNFKNSSIKLSTGIPNPCPSPQMFSPVGPPELTQLLLQCIDTPYSVSKGIILNSMMILFSNFMAMGCLLRTKCPKFQKRQKKSLALVTHTSPLVFMSLFTFAAALSVNHLHYPVSHFLRN